MENKVVWMSRSQKTSEYDQEMPQSKTIAWADQEGYRVFRYPLSGKSKVLKITKYTRNILFAQTYLFEYVGEICFVCFV